MKKLYYLDKLGWPVELIKERWFLNFLRILIHTRTYTFKKPFCLMTGQEQTDVNLQKAGMRPHPHPQLQREPTEIQGCVLSAMQRSHIESLENAGYQSEPNALTRETIEKAERDEDVKSFDTVEELFEDLDKEID